MAFAAALLTVVIAGGILANAKSGQTVRVSTVKELNAAIKKADVGTIILRTQAYNTIKIKAVKEAKEKFLIIDAPNASITNKAVFAEINIKAAGDYLEQVSGNKISFNNDEPNNSFIISKGKVLNELTVNTSYGYFDLNYILRKGAKIKNINMVYSGNNAPVESTYNQDKKQLSLEFSDSDGCKRAYTIKLDKRGRVVRETCKSNWVEYDYDYSYKYDSNGNMVKMSGKDNESGNFTYVYTYSKNLIQKAVAKEDAASGEWNYSYDKKGVLTQMKYVGKGQMDGSEFDLESTETYETDKNGRLSFMRYEDGISGYFTEYYYTYNSKGLLTKKLVNNSGSESTYTYKYNKAGDKTSETYTNEGSSNTTTYKYDKLGNPVK